jgi:hypothetical protein
VEEIRDPEGVQIPPSWGAEWETILKNFAR